MQFCNIQFKYGWGGIVSYRYAKSHISKVKSQNGGDAEGPEGRGEAHTRTRTVDAQHNTAPQRTVRRERQNNSDSANVKRRFTIKVERPGHEHAQSAHVLRGRGARAKSTVHRDWGAVLRASWAPTKSRPGSDES